MATNKNHDYMGEPLTDERAQAQAHTDPTIEEPITELDRAPRKNALLDDILALPAAERVKAYSYYRRLVGDAKALATFVDKIIEVEGAIYYPASTTKEGRTIHFERSVLAIKGGDAVAAASDQAATFAKELVTLFGIGPWEHTLKVKIGKQKTTNGSTYTFNIV